MDEKLMLQDNDLTTNTMLGGNIDVDKFRVCVQNAQLSRLVEVLGDDLYEKMRDDYEFPLEYTGDYLTLYGYIKPFLIMQSAVEYLEIGAFTAGDSGLFKMTPQNGQPLDVSDISYLVKNHKNKSDMYLGRIEKWLCKNGHLISEYETTSEQINNPKRGGYHGISIS